MKPPSHCTIIKNGSGSLTVHPYHAIVSQRKFDLPKVLNAIEQGFKAAGSILQLGDIDLTIYASDTDYIMPEFGFGAITFSANAMTLTLSPASPILTKSLKTELAAVIAHELNHAARFAAISIGPNQWTFRQSLALEGLAEVFQEQLFPAASTHINAQVGNDLDKWLGRAKPLLNKQRHEYDHAAWFYGSSEIPRWAAYTIAYYLVKERLNSQGWTMEQAVGKPADELIVIK